jgi:predicted metal-dependent HD superfamily phosphohydrolase
MAGTSEDLALLTSLLRQIPVADAAKADLLRRMDAADRHYHDTGHLATLWRRHLVLSPGTGMDDAALTPRLAAAILWHDSIYVPGLADNELRSAELWCLAASGGGFDAATVAWVAAAIAATADHLAPRPPDDSLDEQVLRWMLDLDLTPLGEPAEEFCRNTKKLEQEFASVTEEAWEERRFGWLRRVANAPQIYRHPVIATAYDTQARLNLARELARFGEAQ